MEEQALFVVPDEPEREESEEHQDRTEFLHDVQRAEVAAAEVHDRVADAGGQQAGIDEQRRRAGGEERRPRDPVSALREYAGQLRHVRPPEWATQLHGQISDNSFFTHLATGRLILDGGIPRHDPYSFTAAGEPWVVQSWLASWLYGWVDSWWGPDGLRILMGLTTAGLAAIVWALTRPAKGLVGRIVITGLVLGVGTSVWAPRPLLLGLVLLGLTLLVAEGRIPPPVLLPALWIWVNVHGSFPLALVALATLAIGRKLDGDHPGLELRALAWAAGGVALGVLNPLGPVLVFFPVRLLQRQEVLQQIIEWQSPSFSSGWARLFLLQVLLAVVLLVRRPSYRTAIPLVVFTAAALLGVRNVAVASIVIVPGMAYGLAGLGSITGTERRGKGAVAALAVIAVLGRLPGGQRHSRTGLRPARPTPSTRWRGPRTAGWMIPTVNTATQETVGNAVELFRGRDARAYIDDRVDMYPAEVVDDFLDGAARPAGLGGRVGRRRRRCRGLGCQRAARRRCCRPTPTGGSPTPTAAGSWVAGATPKRSLPPPPPARWPAEARHEPTTRKRSRSKPTPLSTTRYF